MSSGSASASNEKWLMKTFSSGPLWKYLHPFGCVLGHQDKCATILLGIWRQCSWSQRRLDSPGFYTSVHEHAPTLTQWKSIDCSPQNGSTLLPQRIAPPHKQWLHPSGSTGRDLHEWLTQMYIQERLFARALECILFAFCWPTFFLPDRLGIVVLKRCRNAASTHAKEHLTPILIRDMCFLFATDKPCDEKDFSIYELHHASLSFLSWGYNGHIIPHILFTVLFLCFRERPICSSESSGGQIIVIPFGTSWWPSNTQRTDELHNLRPCLARSNLISSSRSAHWMMMSFGHGSLIWISVPSSFR